MQIHVHVHVDVQYTCMYMYLHAEDVRETPHTLSLFEVTLSHRQTQAQGSVTG